MTSVLFRPVAPEDVPRVAAFLANPDLAGRRGLPRTHEGPRSVHAVTTAVEEMVASEFGACWAVDVDGLVVGLASAEWWWDALSPWVHVVIDPAHRRRGHGSAAVRHALDFVFSETVAQLAMYSVPSWDADGLSFADALGGLRAGARRRVGVRRGRFYDAVTFVLARQIWEEQHGTRG